MPTLVLLSFGLVVLGLIGTAAVVDQGWSRIDIGRRLGASLASEGVEVTFSDTDYSTEHFSEQVSRRGTVGLEENPGRLRLPTGPTPALLHSDTPSTQAADTALADNAGARRVGDQLDQPHPTHLEQETVRCLRHLRIPLDSVESVDYGRMNGKQVAVVVTTGPQGSQARAIALSCPALGNPVLVGPVDLPDHVDSAPDRTAG